MFDVYQQTVPEALHLVDLGLFPTLIFLVFKDCREKLFQHLPDPIKSWNVAMERLEARLSTARLLMNENLAPFVCKAGFRFTEAKNETVPLYKAFEFRQLMLIFPLLFANLFEAELTFQVKKVMVVEEYLKAYEHLCDPLEALRLLQIIVDTIASRPRLNLNATYFLDSYKCESDLLEEKHGLASELFRFQKELEKSKNEESRKFQELKMRKLLEFAQGGKWKYKKDREMVERMGSTETAKYGADHAVESGATK